MFEGFSHHKVKTTGAEINFRSAGQGPPLLLLHGYPQTHAMWPKIAPELARHFTVIAADLRGYGDSSKPPSDPRHTVYSKRAMALDMVELMASLGFRRFLHIVTTHTMWTKMDKALATASYHWLFLMQPDGLPETMIGKDPAYDLRETMRRWAMPGFEFAPDAMAEYIRCFSDPAAIHAACEDYRAGGSIDYEPDSADFGTKKITVLALWGDRGIASRSSDPLAAWRPWTVDVRGQAIAECGHFLPEEAPLETRKAMEEFL